MYRFFKDEEKWDLPTFYINRKWSFSDVSDEEWEKIMYLIQSISEEEVYDLVVDYVNKRENEWKQEICDECDGEGVVTNDDFIEQSCDSCGGEGIIK